MEVLRAVGAAFMADHPETAVHVPPSVQSCGGILAVRTGNANLGRIARPLTLEERAEASSKSRCFVSLRPSSSTRRPTCATSAPSRQLASSVVTSPIGRRLEAPPAEVRRDGADSTLKVLRATMRGWRDLVVTERSKAAETTQDAINLEAKSRARSLSCRIAARWRRASWCPSLTGATSRMPSIRAPSLCR